MLIQNVTQTSPFYQEICKRVIVIRDMNLTPTIEYICFIAFSVKETLELLIKPMHHELHIGTQKILMCVYIYIYTYMELLINNEHKWSYSL